MKSAHRMKSAPERSSRLLPVVRSVAWWAADTAARPTAAERLLPDYLVIGAQRSGTTSLQQILSGHPDVDGPRLKKGVHYFDTAYHRDLAWYRSQFPRSATLQSRRRRTGRRRMVGEASPYYLFHPAVADRVAATIPAVKLIALLRDPVERAISHHKHEVRRGFESLDLGDALEAEERRLAGEEARLLREPGYVSRSHQHHSYAARGRYHSQLERYRWRFPPEKMLVLETETFWESPQASLALVTEFLGLAPWRPAAFPHANATRPSPVDPGVRRLLEDQFRPSNSKLGLMVDTRLRWT